ncbi:MAG: hypothetical protein A2033_06165 [Bacteroidetes bacterium GWA2_31_9]|nr:MAG: hypothetical protein A2033_06165 [Bacteroidetes bacterium GWA2_31_9]
MDKSHFNIVNLVSWLSIIAGVSCLIAGLLALFEPIATTSEFDLSPLRSLISFVCDIFFAILFFISAILVKRKKTWTFIFALVLISINFLSSIALIVNDGPESYNDILMLVVTVGILYLLVFKNYSFKNSIGL